MEKGMSREVKIEISELNEGTDTPWWVILDPKQNMRADVNVLANMITGPFFSRDAAESHMRNRRYAFGQKATVYCMSGYWSRQYKEAYEAGVK